MRANQKRTIQHKTKQHKQENTTQNTRKQSKTKHNKSKQINTQQDKQEQQNANEITTKQSKPYHIKSNQIKRNGVCVTPAWLHSIALTLNILLLIPDSRRFLTSACATSNGKVVVHDLPLELTVLCIAAVVCRRLNSIVERQFTVGSRQAVQHYTAATRRHSPC